MDLVDITPVLQFIDTFLYSRNGQTNNITNAVETKLSIIDAIALQIERWAYRQFRHNSIKVGDVNILCAIKQNISFDQITLPV